MLKVEGLWKTYTVDGGEIPAVRGVSFTVQTGEFFTLLGPSGCGKSTWVEQHLPEHGVIALDGLREDQRGRAPSPGASDLDRVAQRIEKIADRLEHS